MELLPERPPSDSARTELKYSVPEEVAAHALSRARAALVPDPHALSPTQRVTSLYLDTPDLTFLRWSLARASDRFKLRLRRYGDMPSATCYAELKRKTSSVVRKTRAAVPLHSVDAVLRAQPHDAAAFAKRDRDHLRAFVRHRCELSATPRILITSLREALRAPDPGELTAVTIDRGLSCQPACGVDLLGDPDAWTPIALPHGSEPSRVLLEVKLGAQRPAWLAALVEHLTPWRVSFSKYVAAMRTV
jgi:hypothetical protein